MRKKSPYVKIYHGYGYSGKMVVYGHVFKKEPNLFLELHKGVFSNLLQLLRLFSVKGISNVEVILECNGERVERRTEEDGFFYFEWQPVISPAPGRHTVKISLKEKNELVATSSEGSVFVLHESHFVFVSDIDDTIIKSYSSTTFRKLFELILHNPEKRKLFEQGQKLYQMLSGFQAGHFPNPFFYVSSSEWNFYDYLQTIFRFNRLPEGIFLLSRIKSLTGIFKTGRKNHQGKLLHIIRLIETFPNQRYVLIGDNSQKDPVLYAQLAKKYPDRIFAILIRDIRFSRYHKTQRILEALPEEIHAIQFKHSSEAIQYAESIFKEKGPELKDSKLH